MDTSKPYYIIFRKDGTEKAVSEISPTHISIRLGDGSWEFYYNVERVCLYNEHDNVIRTLYPNSNERGWFLSETRSVK